MSAGDGRGAPAGGGAWRIACGKALWPVDTRVSLGAIKAAAGMLAALRLTGSREHQQPNRTVRMSWARPLFSPAPGVLIAVVMAIAGCAVCVHQAHTSQLHAVSGRPRSAAWCCIVQSLRRHTLCPMRPGPSACVTDPSRDSPEGGLHENPHPNPLAAATRRQLSPEAAGTLQVGSRRPHINCHLRPLPGHQVKLLAMGKKLIQNSYVPGASSFRKQAARLSLVQGVWLASRAVRVHAHSCACEHAGLWRMAIGTLYGCPRAVRAPLARSSHSLLVRSWGEGCVLKEFSGEALHRSSRLSGPALLVFRDYSWQLKPAATPLFSPNPRLRVLTHKFLPAQRSMRNAVCCVGRHC
jgi:hypothetical protein